MPLFFVLAQSKKNIQILHIINFIILLPIKITLILPFNVYKKKII